MALRPSPNSKRYLQPPIDLRIRKVFGRYSGCLAQQ